MTWIDENAMSVRELMESEALDWLYDVAAQVPTDQAIVELGVFQGGSLQHLDAGARNGHQAKVFGLDAWGLAGSYTKQHLRKAYGIQNRALAAAAAPNAILIRADTKGAAPAYGGPPIGLLVIDADHSYANAMGDFKAWEQHLAPHAYVAFDDYWKGRFDGVIQCVDELIANGTLKDFQLIGTRFAATRLA